MAPRRKPTSAGARIEREDWMLAALRGSDIWIWDWDLASDTVTWLPDLPPVAATPGGTRANAADWMAAVVPEDLAALQEALAACLRGDGPYEAECRVRQADGSIRWVQGTGRRFPDAAGAPVRLIGSARDITERKLADLDRERRLEAEREAARLRDAFVGVVTHELRTPITTIFGGTRVLARRWRTMDAGARDELLSDVAEESDRLFRLVEDLLVLTRVERGALDLGDDPANLGRVLDRVIGTERARRPGIAFDVHVPVDLPSIRGEESYLEQVLRNLIDNAAKYGGDNSTVTVTAAAGRGEVEVQVLDHGPGVTDAEADRLFDLFYRSPALAGNVAGAGIGLFVCRQLVEAMGGRIRAERRPGGGAAFIVTMPRYEDDEA